MVRFTFLTLQRFPVALHIIYAIERHEMAFAKHGCDFPQTGEHHFTYTGDDNPANLVYNKGV